VSHDAHGAPGAADGHPPLAASAEIALGVKFLVFLGVLTSLMQGSFVVAASGFGRVWPAADSAKLPLPPAKLK
jgi:hypothetical protein